MEANKIKHVVEQMKQEMSGFLLYTECAEEETNAEHKQMYLDMAQRELANYSDLKQMHPEAVQHIHNKAAYYAKMAEMTV